VNIKRIVASATTVGLIGLGGVVLAAGPAAADDHGPLIPGNIYLFNAQVNLDSAVPSNVITSGGGNQLNQWKGLALDTPASQVPAGTTNIQEYVRIPNGNTDPNLWDEIAASPYSVVKDNEGRFYSYATNQGFFIGTVQNYLNTHNHTGDLKLIVVAQDDNANSLGYWSTDVTVSTSATPDPMGTDITWTVTTPPPALAQVATSTSLSAVPTTIEQGDNVALTATVTPASATGNVQFFDGATSLGTSPISGGTAILNTNTLALGSRSITAHYVGTADNAASTSAAVAVTVNPVAPRSTTTTLVVSSPDTNAFTAVTFHVTVTASTGAANGTVAYMDGATSLGTAQVVAGVVADYTTNALAAGNHSLTAVFTGTAPYTNSTSSAQSLSLTQAGGATQFNVVVTIPQGAITITTPYTQANPLSLGNALLDETTATYSASAPLTGIQIKDTRSGNLGFTATIVAGAFQNGAVSFGGNYAGLTALAATQVAGNALQAGNVVLTNHAPFTDGLGTAKTFATYAPGLPIGTANINGTFGIDKVPTSVTPGLYTSLVTLTAV
jgi:hypothetical protein